MSDVTGRDVDRGWAWVVLLAAALCMALEEAFAASMGMFQVEFLAAFSGSQGYVALICAIPISAQVGLGPVSGMLSDVLSHRATIMAGGALRSVALLSASFSPDLSTLLVLFSVMAGLGAGLCYTPCATIACTYFHKYRTVANGITLGAPGLGIVAGPYLLGWLIDSYGWRYAMVAQAGLMAQTCALAALFYPHTPATLPTTTTTTTTTTTGCCRPRRGKSSTRVSGSAVNTSSRTPTKDTDLVNPPHNDNSQHGTEQEVMPAPRTDAEVKTGSRTELQILTGSVAEPEGEMRAEAAAALAARAKTDLLVEGGSERDSEAKAGLVPDLQAETGSRSRAGQGSRPASSTLVYEMGSVMLNRSVVSLKDHDCESKHLSFRQRVVRLLCQRALWIVCVNQTLMLGSMSINVVLFPAFARSMGAASDDIPVLYTAYGLVISVSRVVGGFVFSAIPGHLIQVLLGLQVVQAVVFLFFPVYGVTLPAMFVGQVMYALTYGPSYILLSPIILRYVPVSDLSMAFGLVMLCSGLAYITASPIAGIAYDITQSYSAAYYIAGSLVGAGALLLLLLLFVKDLQPPGVKVDKVDKLLSTNQKSCDISEQDVGYETANGNWSDRNTEHETSNDNACDVKTRNS